MKKLIIGRNNACDIVIPDTTDIVSRKQAVLAFNFWGKMILFDTSNNGTYVNGQRLENGKGVRVTRKDKVSFARVADLDWNTVRDPYHGAKVLTWIIALTVLLLGAATAWWFLDGQERFAPKQDATVAPAERGGTTTTVPQSETKPVEEQAEKPASQTRRKASRRNNDQTRTDSPKDKAEKEIDEKTPIVY